MTSKLKSRKFWIALQAAVVGLIVLIIGAVAGEVAQIATGAAIEIAAVLGYLTAEGAIDRERAKKE